MSRNLVPLSLAACLLGGTALAQTPRVSVDIAPVHALVARVMQGVGLPDLIVAPGASPHEYSLRPSQAAALQAADLVFWVGPDLTPWLDGAIGTLAGSARVSGLLAVEGTQVLAFRDGVAFPGHPHDAEHEHKHEHDKDHAHDAEHDHDHADDKGHAHDKDHAHDHADEMKDGHGHDHAGGTDPHAWLSPQNAALWMQQMARDLAAVDPQNAAVYLANAEAAGAEIDALTAEISAILAPVRGGRFVVFHDAYQYFETSFDFPASGSIALSDAVDPSPARIAAIREVVAELGVRCVLSEPQFNPDLVATVVDGSDARTAVLDPLGSDLPAGAELYPQMMRNLARSLAGCL